MVANFVMFSWYDYSFYASSDDRPDYPPVPKWVFAVAAINIFIAYTLGRLDIINHISMNIGGFRPIINSMTIIKMTFRWNRWETS